MDELEKLKSIWKSSPDLPEKGEEEIAQMLDRESNFIITRLKRSVWFELIFTAVTALILLWAAMLTDNKHLLTIIVISLVLSVFYLIYYYRMLRTLGRYYLMQDNIKTRIKSLADALSSYLRFYKMSLIILYPLIFLFVIGMMAGRMGVENFLHLFSDTSFLLRFVLFIILCVVFVYSFSYWYLNKLYGNHLKKLHNLLKELEE